MTPGAEADHHPGEACCQECDRGPLDRDETDGFTLRAPPIGEVGGNVANAPDDVELTNKSSDQGLRGVRNDPVAVGICDTPVRAWVRPPRFHQTSVTASEPNESATTQGGRMRPPRPAYGNDIRGFGGRRRPVSL